MECFCDKLSGQEDGIVSLLDSEGEDVKQEVSDNAGGEFLKKGWPKYIYIYILLDFWGRRVLPAIPQPSCHLSGGSRPQTPG